MEVLFDESDGSVDRAQGKRRAGLGGAEAITVVSACSQPLVQRGIASVLAGETDVRLLAQVSSAAAAQAAATRHRPRVMIVGTTLSEGRAFDVLRHISQACADTRTVILADKVTQPEFMRARRAGVRGILLTDMPAEMLPRCIRTVAQGDEFVERHLFLKAFNHLSRGSAAREQWHERLTRREAEAVKLVLKGASNKQIAGKLNIAEGTAKLHVHRAYEKLGVRGRVGLLLYAQKQDIL